MESKQKQMKQVGEGEKDCLKKSKYDFSDFEIIEPSRRKKANMVLSVFEDGTVSANGKLLEHFPEYYTEVRLKNDGTEIVLLSKGKNRINLGKNGRIKNYDIVQKLKKSKVRMPAYYVGEWDEEEQLWIGKYSGYNPSRGEKHKKQ